MNIRGRKCPECGARVWANMKYCGQCGHKMEDASETEEVRRVIRDELVDEINRQEKKIPEETVRWSAKEARDADADADAEADEEAEDTGSGRTLGKSFLIGAIAAAAVIVVVLAIILIARTNRPVSRPEEQEGIEAVHVISAGGPTATPEPEEEAPKESSSPLAKTSVTPTPVPAPEDGELVYVIPTGMNLRAGPGTEYDIVDSVEKGTALRRIGTEEDWSRVMYNGRECYVLSALVTTEAPDETPEPTWEPTEEPEPTERTGVPAGRQDDTRGLVITNHGANVRSGPGTEYEVIDSVLEGEELRTTGAVDGWYRVEYGSTTGYISETLLDVIREPEIFQEKEPEQEETFWIEIQGKANIRTGPGTQYDILGAVEEGDYLEATGQEGSWYIIRFNGQTGYVSANLAERS